MATKRVFDFTLHRDGEDIAVEVEILDFYRGRDAGYWQQGSYYNDDSSEVSFASHATTSSTGQRILLTPSENDEIQAAFWLAHSRNF
jgi:hypothetical protein